MKNLSMKKNYFLIVCLLFASYMMYSWTSIVTPYKTKQHNNINDVELVTPEFEPLYEIPIQLFSLEQEEEINSEYFLFVEQSGSYFELEEKSLIAIAICEDINVYLDATGNVNITAMDVDNSSTGILSIDVFTLSSNAIKVFGLSNLI